MFLWRDTLQTRSPFVLENIKTMVLVILISTAVDISILLLCFGHSTVDIFQSFYRGFCSLFAYLIFSILSAMTSSQRIPFLHISKQGETWWLASSQINWHLVRLTGVKTEMVLMFFSVTQPWIFICGSGSGKHWVTSFPSYQSHNH